MYVTWGTFQCNHDYIQSIEPNCHGHHHFNWNTAVKTKLLIIVTDYAIAVGYLGSFTFSLKVPC